MSTAPDSPWFHRYAAHRPAVRLVCFPHAGGTTSLFHGWAARVPPELEMLAVQYPGRRTRLAEPCVTTMDEMADRITDALKPYDDTPLALFGHSMGSAIAFEVARRLEDRTGILPVRLFASGWSAPAAGRLPDLVPPPDEETVLASVRQLDPEDAAVFDEPELRELLLPPVCADYRLLAAYRMEADAAISVPITACGGDRDPSCPPQSLTSWGRRTTAGAEVCVFEGDHFYLRPSESQVVGLMTARLLAGEGRIEVPLGSGGW
ncbi:thioesterase II family protein [Kitasatospora sp. NPDC058162]|uniref:thioesterase II family protein n=1 Tax=Kitasatospora sp. NPDC058162 TaxID=3346362 RepID=UPI0036D81B5C